MSTIEEGIKANRERAAKRKSFGEEGRKRFEKEVGGPAFKKDIAKKMTAIERSNKQVAQRNAGKTKEQISEEAFKSGRTSGRY